MTRCRECDHFIWPWQETASDWTFRRIHRSCYERYWDEFFARVTPEQLARAGNSRFAYEVLLMAPPRWVDRLRSALDSAAIR